MKFRSLLFFIGMSVLPVFAFAAPKNSSNVDLDQAVKVAGTQLAAGQYKVRWEGSGPDVQVSFLKGKKVVATTSARIGSAVKNEENAIETGTIDNAVVLRAIDMKNLSLRFDNAGSAQGN